MVRVDRATGNALHVLGLVLTVAAIVAVVWQYAAVYAFPSWWNLPEVSPGDITRYVVLTVVGLVVALGALVFSIVRRSIPFLVAQLVMTVALVLAVVLFAVPGSA